MANYNSKAYVSYNCVLHVVSVLMNIEVAYLYFCGWRWSLRWYSTLDFQVSKPGIQADRLLTFINFQKMIDFGSLQPFTVRGFSQFPVGIGIQ